MLGPSSVSSVFPSRQGRQVHHHVDAGKRWLDRVEVGDVGLVARHARHRTPVQSSRSV